MKLQNLLVLAAGAIAVPTPDAVAEPAPSVLGPTIEAQRLLCAGDTDADTFKSSGDIQWGLDNRRDELDLHAGWWNEVDTVCTVWNITALVTPGVLITYNHARNHEAMTTLDGGKHLYYIGTFNKAIAERLQRKCIALLQEVFFSIRGFQGHLTGGSNPSQT
ncbi:hypothetical protein CORC01_00438 [Colletotrichum orchidophilum]|uniref:Ecp2 effector protein domain-containing protein n=1 Tax=Colletotrichum orchidophilum TaxID=1209926 RepID=A0A1G4BRM3_9PEZI|nr:uncharacterized protein CORC01_00438 [Colletotrichum orchidophilum]OHF04099.1 hypothetical protein CORC01_00438 [Colletotrichum orchidophilum]